MTLSRFCSECISYRTQKCEGKRKIGFIKPGKYPCKNYQFDPSLVSDQDIEPDGVPPSLKDKPVVSKRLIPENILPTSKTKADNFERLAIQRLTKLLDGFRVLGNLSNKANYEWIQEQIDIMLNRVRSAADSLEKKFEK